ncbi:hypothetical protein QE385_002174 [Sphingomonas sp. SORGH_AS 950]|uniref:hypothetical protein n=1 Tax=Sphingomonas sp. SORGH_AS_0950 TaxID=3041792 RepID=UPI00277D319E|nr:hypothetical protein [Sphingomonas sp. SORGH_AS_0950]MDQ1157847.1 hypothetical protein [Sphingomonas sp. SORGH_AS_0950]
MSGRPLRFLGGTLALWTLGRVAFLLPSETDAPVTAVRPPTLHLAMRSGAQPVAVRAVRPGTPEERPTERHPERSRSIPVLAPAPPPLSSVMPFPDDTPGPNPPADAIPLLPEGPRPPDRWSASAWAILRRGGDALTPGGQLGGSQAGVRLLRRLDRSGTLSASLRVSSALNGMSREIAPGLDWRPFPHGPVRVLVEQRIPLDGGDGGPALLAVAGIGPRPVAPGLALTLYAQAGAVARARIEPFADGAARVTTPLAAGIDLGLGLWGGAQREVRRLDIGPTLGVGVPLAGRWMRLSLDWRQRIAGRAAPNSGPALSLAGDF